MLEHLEYPLQEKLDLEAGNFATLSKTWQNSVTPSESDTNFDRKNHNITGLLGYDYLVLNCTFQDKELFKFLINANPDERMVLSDRVEVLYGLLRENGSTYHRTGIFNRCFTVYLDNLPFCDLLALPNANLNGFESTTAHLKIHNSHLYTKNRKNLKKCVSAVLSVVKLKFERLNRVDICFDSNSDLYHNQSKSNAISQIQNEKFTYDYSTNRKGNKVNFRTDTGTAQISTKSRNTFVRSYNKSLELENSGKEYITEYFRQNGLNLSDSIYRTELQVNTQYLKGFEYSFDDIFTGNFMESLFEKAFLRYQFDNLTFDYSTKAKAVDLKRVESVTTKQSVCRTSILALEKLATLKIGSYEAVNSLLEALFSELDTTDTKTKKFTTHYNLKAKNRKQRLIRAMQNPSFKPYTENPYTVNTR